MRKAALPPAKSFYGVSLESEFICPNKLEDLAPAFHRWMYQDVEDTSNRLVLTNFKI
jgi:hypothetical protein